MIKGNNLYHFTKAETALNYILKEKTIKFSSFKNVNDPKESKEWPFQFYGNNIGTVEKFSSKIYYDINNYIKEHWLTACFSIDKEGEEIWKNLKMWDSYADRNKGVCLVFDKDKLKKNLSRNTNNFLFHRDIEYVNKRDGETSFFLVKGKFLIFQGAYPPFLINDLKRWMNILLLTNETNSLMIFLEVYLNKGTDRYMKWHTINFYNSLFFNKARYWASENEYRFILFSDDLQPYKCIDYGDALEAVILGCDIDSKLKMKIEQLLQEHEITCYQLISNNWYEAILNKEDLEDDSDVHFIDTIIDLQIQQRYAISPLNSNDGANFALFDWKTGDVTILPK
ncbi:DUF2971 domain-containing protein [Listeria ilorinensis]|uniref:DUF2971 domain-containing protein n=1 Tax=Listeria ilorinensis TaxID=2867439 RepID=UPI001EF572CC|nr:DUF2971 domain-containing protein [Listeria ilorinensis]